METILSLPLWSEGIRRGVEKVPGVSVPEGVRLLVTPGMVDGLAADDVIVLADGEPGYRIVERGGNFGVWIWFDGRVEKDDDRVVAARGLAEQLEGRLDGGTSRSVVLTIPAKSGFARICSALDAWVGARPFAVWEFTNAYAPDGETPLDWWTPL